MKTAKGA